MIDEALAQLSLDEKCGLLSGQDMWTLPALPGIGLASLVMSDGPIGVRGTDWSPADPSIAMPSPTALSATWDRDLARRYGALLAQEARRKGVHVLLGPTINLHRSPLGGRHFECYSEDPLLTGEIGAAFVTGVQEGGVAACPKHFVANDSETNRMTVNVKAEARTLRELYLAPFENIVHKAKPWTIMAAYNSVNGTTMSEHDELQNQVLRGEWGFDGIIVSDWTAARDTVGNALGGLDIAMPGPRSVYGPALATAVREGKVPEKVVDELVRRVLLLAERVGALGGTAPAPSDEIDGAALAREVARRSFVLVRNEGLLPLPPVKKIALIGHAADEARVLGGGSAQVFPPYIASPLDGLRAALGADTELVHAPGADPRVKIPAARHGFDLTVRLLGSGDALLGEHPLPEAAIEWVGNFPGGVTVDELKTIEITGSFTPETSGVHTFAVAGLGPFKLTVGGEVVFDDAIVPDGDDPFGSIMNPEERLVELPLIGGERVTVSLTKPYTMDATLPIAFALFRLGHQAPITDPEALIEEAVAAAASADVAVVVVATTMEVESESFDRTDLRLPGRQDELVARVAAANPRTVVVVNTGSPVEMPWADDVQAVLLTWFPGQEGGNALADVLLGHAEPGGRLPTTWPVAMDDCPVLQVTPVDGALPYDEGVFIGYRAWEKSGKTPRYPFGHGLGYTTWEYDYATFTPASGDDLGTLIVGLRNAGDRRGQEVVQTYLTPKSSDGTRPARWLAGFASVTAEPGETVEVEITVPRRTAEIWAGQGWQFVPGDYELQTGSSINDVRLATPFSI